MFVGTTFESLPGPSERPDLYAVPPGSVVQQQRDALAKGTDMYLRDSRDRVFAASTLVAPECKRFVRAMQAIMRDFPQYDAALQARALLWYDVTRPLVEMPVPLLPLRPLGRAWFDVMRDMELEKQWDDLLGSSTVLAASNWDDVGVYLRNTGRSVPEPPADAHEQNAQYMIDPLTEEDEQWLAGRRLYTTYFEPWERKMRAMGRSEALIRKGRRADWASTMDDPVAEWMLWAALNEACFWTALRTELDEDCDTDGLREAGWSVFSGMPPGTRALNPDVLLSVIPAALGLRERPCRENDIERMMGVRADVIRRRRKHILQRRRNWLLLYCMFAEHGPYRGLFSPADKAGFQTYIQAQLVLNSGHKRLFRERIIPLLDTLDSVPRAAVFVYMIQTGAVELLAEISLAVLTTICDTIAAYCQTRVDSGAMQFAQRAPPSVASIVLFYATVFQQPRVFDLNNIPVGADEHFEFLLPLLMQTDYSDNDAAPIDVPTISGTMLDAITRWLDPERPFRRFFETTLAMEVVLWDTYSGASLLDVIVDLAAVKPDVHPWTPGALDLLESFQRGAASVLLFKTIVERGFKIKRQDTFAAWDNDRAYWSEPRMKKALLRFYPNPRRPPLSYRVPARDAEPGQFSPPLTDFEGRVLDNVYHAIYGGQYLSALYWIAGALKTQTIASDRRWAYFLPYASPNDRSTPLHWLRTYFDRVYSALGGDTREDSRAAELSRSVLSLFKMRSMRQYSQEMDGIDAY